LSSTCEAGAVVKKYSLCPFVTLSLKKAATNGSGFLTSARGEKKWRMPLCAISSVDNFYPYKNRPFPQYFDHFWIKNRIKQKKTEKNMLRKRNMLNIAQRNLTYLTHLNPNFARFRAATLKLFAQNSAKTATTLYESTP